MLVAQRISPPNSKTHPDIPYPSEYTAFQCINFVWWQVFLRCLMFKVR
jgi:hypothetical protein